MSNRSPIFEQALLGTESPVDLSLVDRVEVVRGPIDNLFDAAYGDPASVEHRQAVIPQDGRTAVVRVYWRF